MIFDREIRLEAIEQSWGGEVRRGAGDPETPAGCHTASAGAGRASRGEAGSAWGHG